MSQIGPNSLLEAQAQVADSLVEQWDHGPLAEDHGKCDILFFLFSFIVIFGFLDKNLIMIGK